MTDSKTLAYINLYAVLGSIPRLCELDERARELIKNEKISLGFRVKGGPSGALCFADGRAWFAEECDSCNIILPFSSPEKFNGMIDGTVTPIPSKGFARLGFLLKKFMPLTDILSSYLRADEKALEDPIFFEKSTLLMFHLIANAIAQIGNVDMIGQASASYIVDGTIKLAIGDDHVLGIEAKDHVLRVLKEAPKSFSSFMRFEDIKLARDLFDGRVNAVAAVGEGKVRIGGMISQVDNVNRILDRVTLYLA
ncbi:MAG: hypothetical protein IJF21_06425 [Clostridia bacterium]|nr:hypothetical protein [Clostridia bacterium]MBQ3228524.1 hypothetical protein [Clostridia bacterium]